MMRTEMITYRDGTVLRAKIQEFSFECVMPEMSANLTCKNIRKTFGYLMCQTWQFLQKFRVEYFKEEIVVQIISGISVHCYGLVT